jgi:hypothetical protein
MADIGCEAAWIDRVVVSVGGIATNLSTIIVAFNASFFVA